MPNRTLNPPAAYDDLSALLLNCTLKRSGQTSHTDKLMDVSRAIFDAVGVTHETVRPVDLTLPPGVQPDMTEASEADFELDDWPSLFEKVMAADVLILGTPLWLGQVSSVAVRLTERMYANSTQTNARGQYAYYGKVGGCLITGNEDGAKSAARTLLYALQHLGYTIPPQADAYWVGEAGPGKSYGDQDTGLDNAFTGRNATFMTWNLLHLARLLKDAGGIPAYGNRSEEWQDGERFGHPWLS